MNAPLFTTVKALRAAIASTIVCSAQELQDAVGQVVVATAAELSASAAVGPEDRSAHDVATRTLVLLADRIPVGQEAQALAEEIERNLGRQAAQLVLGEGAVEFANSIQNRAVGTSLDAAMGLLRPDGTLKGLTFGRAQGKRGPCIQIALPKSGINKSVGLEGRDFHELYAEAVALVAGAKGIAFESPEYRAMLATESCFLKANGLDLKPVAYMQVVVADRMLGLDAAGAPSGQEVIGTPDVMSAKERKAEIKSEIAALIRERNRLSIRDVVRKQEAATVYMRLISSELILVRFEPGRIPTTAALNAGVTMMMHHYGRGKADCSLVEISNEGFEGKAFAGEINPATGERWCAKFSLWDWSPEGPVPYLGVGSKLAPPAADQHASEPSI